MSACKHLSASLMQLLLEAEVRQLSLGALQQFNLDVAECEGKEGEAVAALGREEGPWAVASAPPPPTTTTTRPAPGRWKGIQGCSWQSFSS